VWADDGPRYDLTNPARFDAKARCDDVTAWLDRDGDVPHFLEGVVSWVDRTMRDIEAGIGAERRRSLLTHPPTTEEDP
jgi:hypothetical protein